MSISEKYIAELYNKIQEERPIIHCITNAVTVNDCANILLAAGASPTMAHHPLEVEEITAGTKALVCNFGAIADYEAMEKAGRVADELGHAIVIDPVGVSGSSYRREKCQTLIENIHPTCIRGNYSEIRALMEHCSTVTGVDSGDKNLDTEAMRQYADKYHLIMIASGEKDIITDGTAIYICENGDAKMAKITGSGCMSSVMLGAFLGTEPSVQSAAACCAFVGIAGELASEKTDACGGYYVSSQSSEGAHGFEASNTNSRKFKYCIAKTEDTNGNIKKTYYKVTVFFRVDLPIMGEIFTFPVTGETKPIYFPKNDVF